MNESAPFDPDRFSTPEEQERWLATLAKTVAVDFDGVLHPYTEGWVGATPADEQPTSGAREFLAELDRLDYAIVVFSTRCTERDGLDGTVAWLAKHELLQYIAKVTHEKPAAVAYVDDRAVPYIGDWTAVLAGVEALARGRAHGAAPMPVVLPSPEMNDDDHAELERLRLAMKRLNRLRSNVVATQNASWSNNLYPFVAILGDAGYEVEGATDAQMEEHLHCYGGAGRMPTLLDPTPYESPIGRKHPEMPHVSGSVQIHAERWRQESEEGWNADHDDEHDSGELVTAACAYARHAVGQWNGVCWPDDEPAVPEAWPWAAEWWKPSTPVRNLVKAGALLAAEIDRLQRAEP